MSAILVSEGQMTTGKTLMHVSMEDDLLKRLDDFRFERRFPSRAAALKSLLRWALTQNPNLWAEDRN